VRLFTEAEGTSPPLYSCQKKIDPLTLINLNNLVDSYKSITFAPTNKMDYGK
jgi:hypothetical protein